MVTVVPPLVGPLAGEMEPTVGAGDGSYEYVHAQVADCVSAFVTTTALAALGACGPVVQLIEVAVTVTPPSAVPPIVADAPDWKSVPVMGTAVPPADAPFAGEMLV